MQTTDTQVAIATMAPVDREADPDGIVVIDSDCNPDGVVVVDSDCEPDEDVVADGDCEPEEEVIAGVEVCDTVLVIAVAEGEAKEIEVGVTNGVGTGY